MVGGQRWVSYVLFMLMPRSVLARTHAAAADREVDSGVLVRQAGVAWWSLLLNASGTPASPYLRSWKDAVMVLPGDSHVHTEWSWDAPNGSMERTCARAVAMGLPAVAFTEHADYTPWVVIGSDLDGYEHLQAFVTPGG